MLSANDIASMNIKELNAELKKAKAEQFKISMQINTTHEKNTSKKEKNKKVIARLKTAVREVELAEKKNPKKD